MHILTDCSVGLLDSRGKSETDETLRPDVTHLAFVPLAEEAARRSPAGSLALCESEATANVLSVRKRSDSNKASSP